MPSGRPASPVRAYEVDLDLTTGPHQYGSTSRVRFASHDGADTFIELLAPAVHSIVLNGRELDAAEVFDGERVALTDLRKRRDEVCGALACRQVDVAV